MPTRSNIGIEHADGSITFVYCHSNGCPERNGELLQANYVDSAKVLELIGHGDVVLLGASELETEYFHRDLGADESETSQRQCSEREECFEEEYAYVWSYDHWMVRGNDVVGWEPLSVVMERING